MEKRFKVHTMTVSKEIIAWFFTKAEEYLLAVELVKVVDVDDLLVDVIYEPSQRLQMMMLIEGVNDFLNNEQERKLQEDEE